MEGSFCAQFAFNPEIVCVKKKEGNFSSCNLLTHKIAFYEDTGGVESFFFLTRLNQNLNKQLKIYTYFFTEFEKLYLIKTNNH